MHDVNACQEVLTFEQANEPTYDWPMEMSLLHTQLIIYSTIYTPHYPQPSTPLLTWYKPHLRSNYTLGQCILQPTAIAIQYRNIELVGPDQKA